jgi:small subunit ribosomal protein S20
MPNTKSATKALRQSKTHRTRNIKRQNAIRNLNKEFRKLIEAKKFKDAQKLLPQLYKALDKAAKRNVIKKNTAARKKSRITKRLKKAAVAK